MWSLSTRQTKETGLRGTMSSDFDCVASQKDTIPGEAPLYRLGDTRLGVAISPRFSACPAFPPRPVVPDLEFLREALDLVAEADEHVVHAALLEAQQARARAGVRHSKLERLVRRGEGGGGRGRREGGGREEKRNSWVSSYD